jgi:hypothetical protein
LLESGESEASCETSQGKYFTAGGSIEVMRLADYLAGLQLLLFSAQVRVQVQTSQ